MRWRRKSLGLPADHFWVMSDWRQFAVMVRKNGAELAAKLGLLPEELELLLPNEQWQKHIYGGPLDVSDLQIAKAVVKTEDTLEKKVLAALFYQIFGIQAEEALSAWAELEVSASLLMPASLQFLLTDIANSANMVLLAYDIMQIVFTLFMHLLHFHNIPLRSSGMSLT